MMLSDLTNLGGGGGEINEGRPQTSTSSFNPGKKDMSWQSMRHHFMSLLLDSIFEKLMFFQRDYFST